MGIKEFLHKIRKMLKKVFVFLFSFYTEAFEQLFVVHKSELLFDMHDDGNYQRLLFINTWKHLIIKTTR